MTDPATSALPTTALPTTLRAPQSRTVQLLLESRIPARMAWIDRNGRPQVTPMWFEWNGVELLVSTFTGARKLADIAEDSHLAYTIDSADFPYRSVKLSGPVTLEAQAGLTDSYRRTARRYLGEVAGAAWCEALEGKSQTLIRVRPTRASESNMSTMPFVTDETVASDGTGER